MMEWLVLLFAGMAFLAYANGANDNFKGVATLYGSRVLSRRQALGWATITTMAGSLTAAWLATALMKLFSGKGLVPDTLIAEPGLMGAVMLGAAAIVALASRLGLPASYTHLRAPETPECHHCALLVKKNIIAGLDVLNLQIETEGASDLVQSLNTAGALSR